MESRIIKLRETFLPLKECKTCKPFCGPTPLSTTSWSSVFKNIENCTFRINLHELNEGRRRSGRVVECTGLENRRTLTRTVGSNPTSSAITKNLIQHIQLVTEFEPDLSPILSPKNYLMLPLTRAQLGTLPHHYTHFFAYFWRDITESNTLSRT